MCWIKIYLLAWILLLANVSLTDLYETLRRSNYEISK